jgi:hypothetical protein
LPFVILPSTRARPAANRAPQSIQIAIAPAVNCTAVMKNEFNT